MKLRVGRRIGRLYTISLAAYASSLLMPAVINPTPTPYAGLVEMWGWQAALLSLVPVAMPTAGPSNIGYLLAAAAVAAGWCRAAVGFCVVSLASMIYCGIVLPPRPGDPIRFPGGHLGPGHYVWLAAGAIMFTAARRASISSRDALPDRSNG